MDYHIEYQDTPVGRQRYEQSIQAVRNRAGMSEKDQASFEDQKKEARLLRKYRAIGKPKDWVIEIEKQLDGMPDGQQRQQIEKLLDKMRCGDDPRVAEPEDGLPDTRDFVLKGSGTVVLDFDEREYLVKRLKETKWVPDWASFGVDLVEYIAGNAGVTGEEKPASNKPHRVKSA